MHIHTKARKKGKKQQEKKIAKKGNKNGNTKTKGEKQTLATINSSGF